MIIRQLNELKETGVDLASVSEWDTNEAYLASAQNVKALNVVNDAAERGVKLATDFVDVARSDEHFQNILHVEDDHKQNSNLRLKKK